MAKHWREKRIAAEEMRLNRFIAEEQNENIVVLKIGSDEFNTIVTDWKNRLHITKAFMEDNRDTFDYRLLKYNEHLYKEEAGVRKYIGEAIDYHVNVFCCPHDEGPDFIVQLLDRRLLSLETYQKIYDRFAFIVVDYKKSKFD